MEALSARSYHRRRLLVNRTLQLPFVRAWIIVLFAMSAATLVAVFIAIRLTLATYELSNDALAAGLFNTVFWFVMVELVVLIPFVVWLGVWLTHRVAGPLVRIQAALAQMVAGDYQVQLRLRKGDMLQDLAEAINRLARETHRRSR